MLNCIFQKISCSNVILVRPFNCISIQRKLSYSFRIKCLVNNGLIFNSFNIKSEKLF